MVSPIVLSESEEIPIPVKGIGSLKAVIELFFFPVFSSLKGLYIFKEKKGDLPLRETNQSKCYR